MEYGPNYGSYSTVDGSIGLIMDHNLQLRVVCVARGELQRHDDARCIAYCL
jgi:hypothetical protein